MKMSTKMFLLSYAAVLSIVSMGLASCGGGNTPVVQEPQVQEPTSLTVADTSGILQNGDIKLIPVLDSPKFPDAKLSIKEPSDNAKLAAGEVKFSYNVENYTLGAQTTDASSKNCANSKEGQHIHLILNNQPYTAHYTSDFSQKLEKGAYVALSFVSRSYHESIKEKNAYTLTKFTVGDAEPLSLDLKQPLLFYSRPKGEYKAADAKRVMLDFYLVNTEISPEGNHVRATIDGKEFYITKWVPYMIEGLSAGKHKVTLELIGVDGQPINHEYNYMEREFTLSDLQ